ncbi:MAG: hypothetical protein WC082_04195, partial [Victivallales bacterium]
MFIRTVILVFAAIIFAGSSLEAGEDSLQYGAMKIRYDFKDGVNPFEFWIPQSKDFKINHFEVVNYEGGKCLFVDVQFTNKTKRSMKYAYWRLPIKKIPVEGLLNFKYKIKYGPNNTARKSGVGILFEVPEIKRPVKANYWINGHTLASAINIPGIPSLPSKSWINYNKNIVPLCSKMSTEYSRKYLGLPYGNAGCIITDIVMLLDGKCGRRAQFYLDHVELTGEIPTLTSYLGVLPERVAKLKQEGREKFLRKKNIVGEIRNTAAKISAAAKNLQVKKYADSLTKSADEVLCRLNKENILTMFEREYFNYEIAAFQKALSELKTAGNYNVNVCGLNIYLLDNPVLPFKILPDGVAPGCLAGELNMVAARGEYESAAVVINPDRDIANVSLKVLELKGEKGGIIPAANVDIRTVKCWYQREGAWFTNLPQGENKILVPELLLKDDSVVKVDTAAKKNLLKLNFPAGSRYEDPANIKGPELADGPDGRYVFPPELFPFMDSEKFKPVNLKSGKNKQFWITVKVPDNIPAGNYTGILKINSPLGLLANVKFTVRVLPFSLPAPIRFDGKEPFVSSIYYRGGLSREYPQGSCSSDIRSKEQLKADYRSMLKHNIYSPTMYQRVRPKIKNAWQLLEKHLELRQNIGVDSQELYSDTIWIGARQEEDKIKSRVTQALQLKKLAGKYGVVQLYVAGIDEARGGLLQKERKSWEALHKQKIKIYVAASEEALKIVGDLLDIINY